MTEDQWLSWPDAYSMLDNCLRCEFPDRKLRLFACACCRRIWQWLEPECLRAAVVVAERFADGTATAAELAEAHRAVEELREAWTDWSFPRKPGERWEGPFDARTRNARAAGLIAVYAVVEAVAPLHRDGEPYVESVRHALIQATHVAGFPLADAYYDGGSTFPAADAYKRHVKPAEDAECRAQADLLRDIFGNPFRPVAFDPEWRTPRVLDLARAIDAGLDFDAMPVLGDALEEAGCGVAEILDHCRAGVGHVRGCWVVDGLTRGF